MTSRQIKVQVVVELQSRRQHFVAAYCLNGNARWPCWSVADATGRGMESRLLQNDTGAGSAREVRRTLLWQLCLSYSWCPSRGTLYRRRLKPRDVVIMRASQLDASRLDIELTAMLQEQFLKAFSLVQPVSSRSSSCLKSERSCFWRNSQCVLQRVINALKPELSLILDFLVSS